MKRALLSLFVFGGLTLAAPAPGNSTMSGGTLPLSPEAEVPEARVPGAVVPELPEPEVPEPDAAPPEVARDVGVAELPLLVTEPPEEPPEADIPAPVTGGADSTFNPFAPLVLPEPGEADEPTLPAGPPAVPGPVAGSAPPPAETAPVPTPQARLGTTTIPDVLTTRLRSGETRSVPATAILERTLSAPAPAAPAAETAAAPPAAPTPVPAPAPRARPGTTTLPAALTARLQRGPARSALSTGILERTLDTTNETVSDSAAVAAIRTPPSLTPAAVPGRGNRATLGLGPVTLMGLAGDGEDLTGDNRVSRSLSDLRVAFSAMATGTGVFRIGDDAVPVLVAVGERLPGTGLVLSRLTASSAQFTEDDVRHTLLLNP